MRILNRRGQTAPGSGARGRPLRRRLGPARHSFRTGRGFGTWLTVVAASAAEQCLERYLGGEVVASGFAGASGNLTAWRVGDLGFVGFGGEVFNEIAKAVNTASPFRSTFIFTHCNGVAGDVPRRASYAEGGHEVQPGPFAPGADEQLLLVHRVIIQSIPQARGTDLCPAVPP